MHLTDNHHTLFVKDKALHFSTVATEKPGLRIMDFRHQEPDDLWKVFHEFQDQPDTLELTLLTDHPSRLLRRLATHFIPVEAAGGLVKNEAGKLLVIYRLQKWDLPKGKLDDGEQPQEAALREVTEECGIGRLVIRGILPFTLHAYPMKDDQWALKKTHWYAMETSDDSPLVPQQQEDIEKALWIGKEEIPMVLSNTYASLRQLFKLAFG